MWAIKTRRKQTRQDRLSVLLTEYQVGTTRADFHTQLIWTWATALIGVNAAGIGLLTQMGKYSEGRFFLISLLAAAASFLVWWWNLAANRWHVLIRMMYMRLHQIEESLGMGLNRSIRLHDESLPPGHPDMEIQKHLRNQTGYPSGSIRLKELRALLFYGVPVVWSLVMLSESLAFVTAGRPCLLVLQSPGCSPLGAPHYFVVLFLWIIGQIPMAAAAALLYGIARGSRQKTNTTKQ